MPTFQYKALTQAGAVVSGTLFAPTADEVAERIHYLDLIPIGSITESNAGAAASSAMPIFGRPRAEDVTVFTVEMALLLKTGARINDALELFARDSDVGRLRATLADVLSAIMAGEAFGDALSRHAALFSPMYVALVRVGEASGTLDEVLAALGAERMRADALRRRLYDAVRYPIFLGFAAAAVLLFFLLFVLPQFAGVLRDFNAKLDPVLAAFLNLSENLRQHTDWVAAGLVVPLLGGWLMLRRPGVRVWMMDGLAGLPLIHPILSFHRTSLFCRNLGLLLGSGVPLTASLKILSEIMVMSGRSGVWAKATETVRHGGKLSDALSATKALPAMAVRTLRLGEETGQLAVQAARIAELYDAKLQRSLDRVIGIIGPLAIVVISVVVGGLIVSVMTALLSVSQVIN